MPGRSLRAAALIAGGAFAVHQMRYLVAYGHDSGHQLAGQGHAYLTPVLVLVALTLALAVARMLARVSRGEPHGRHRSPTLARAWAAASTWLIGLYCLQESLEALLDSGHPAGVAGVLGGGGWVAIPISLVVGLLIAVALRGADAALGLEASPVARQRHPAPAVLFLARVSWSRPRLNVAARHLAGRGPPLASV
jgi:hypothetical protein